MVWGRSYPLGVAPGVLKPGEDADLKRSAVVDALIIVNMQHGLLERQPELVHQVHALTQNFPPEATYWLKFRNMPESMFARHLNWHRMSVPPDTDIVPPLSPDPSRIFTHTDYCLPPDLMSLLGRYKTVALAGTDTDASIYAAAFDLWSAEIMPIVVKPCCGSSRGEHFHTMHLDSMRRQFGPSCIVGSISASAFATG
jgi:nicotinamidase-related amidase